MSTPQVRMTRKDFEGLPAKHAVFLVEYFKDWNAPRAAEYIGLSPEQGHKILADPKVAEAVLNWITNQLEDVGYDAEWIMHELVDNHRIARQAGNITASNTALKALMEHVGINAMAKRAVDHTSSDGSMRQAPLLSPEAVKAINNALEQEL